MADILDLLDDCFEELRKGPEFGSKASTAFHQIVLNVALLLLFIPVTDWFLPRRFRFPVVMGVIVQAAFFLSGRFGAEALGKKLECGGENRRGARVGADWAVSDVAASDLHSDARNVCGNGDCIEPISCAAAIAILVIAYLRKTRLEANIMRETFGIEWDSYQQNTWRLVPLPF